MRWRDCISGREAAEPASVQINGQWRYEAGPEFPVHRATMRPGEVLLGDAGGNLAPPGVGPIHIEPATIPDEEAVRTLVAVGEGIQGKVLGRGWQAWVGHPPLMPLTDESLDETELEQETRRLIGALEEVCRRPRVRLSVHAERQPVSRCRRPSPRAPQVLASHSEDWARRTLFGVHPKRVLGTVRRSSLDMYENQIAAGLVVRLDEAFADQIRAVRRLVKAARAMERWNQALEGGRSFRRAYRICQLWGELWTGAGLLSRAESRLRSLQQLRRRVLSLKDTELSRSLCAGTKHLVLRMSNIFQGDTIYGKVAELWQVWARHVQQGQQTPEERWARAQKASRGMILLGVLIVLRALESLHVQPEEEDRDVPIGPGATLRLSSPCGPLSLEWRRSSQELVLRMLSGPHVLTVATVTGIPAAWGQVETWLKTLPSDPRLILHLAADTPHKTGDAHPILNGPGPVHRWPMMAPIAPWELESVEVVARSLRWFLWCPYLHTYPPRVDLPASPWKPPTDVPSWMCISDTTLAILEPPSPGSRGWMALEKRCEQQQRDLKQLEEKVKQLKARQFRQGELPIKLQQTKERLSWDEAVREGLKDGIGQIQNFIACPVCFKTSGMVIFGEIQGRFKLRCHCCNAEWGVRDCPHCQQLFPFIEPPEARDLEACGDINTAYGSDVLSFPSGDKGYLCPECGEASNGA